MSRDPAFLFYPNDYLGGTMGFSLEQHGMYILLLVYQFNSGPFDYESAQRICGGRFDSIKFKFAFDEISMKYANTRLSLEIIKREKFSQSRRENVQNRYKCNTYVGTSVLHMENENRNRNEDKNDNGTKKEIPKRKLFETPTIEQVRDYCLERKNQIDPDKWLAYYESNGWMVGRNKMKDWKAAIRTWEKNNFDKGASSGTTKRFIAEFERDAVDKYSNLPATQYSND